MPYLTVTGGPLLPNGKTFHATAGKTLLTVEQMEPYIDGDYVYPRIHYAELDQTSSGWKPLGSADGTDFNLPGPNLNDPEGPICLFTEIQTYTDNVTQTSTAWRRIIGDAGSWAYGSADPMATIVTLPFGIPFNRTEIDYNADNDFDWDADEGTRTGGSFTSIDTGIDAVDASLVEVYRDGVKVPGFFTVTTYFPLTIALVDGKRPISGETVAVVFTPL